MPSFADWLRASWGDYRRRCAVLLAVAGLGGAATLAAGFVPFVPAGILSVAGVGGPWAVWGAAVFVSLCGVLWLSTWTQAAMMRAALYDEPAMECLRRAWGQTAAFAWVFSLAVLAVGGGYALFIVPGLALSVLLFAAPFCQVSGEASGAGALGLSWARVKPRFGEVALRLFAATALAAAPGLIPYFGWIIMLFWAPFGVVAMARLDKDLAAAEPQARPPEWMGAAVAALSAVVLLGAAGASYFGVRAARAAAESFNQPGGLASRIRPETAQALVAAYTEPSTAEEKKRLFEEVVAELRTPAAAPATSTGTLQVITTSAAWTAAP